MTEASAPLPLTPARRTGRARPGWLVPAGLIALGLVPILAGAFRISSLAQGGTVTAENARFVDSPVPVVVHIVGSSVFLVLGALQFAPSLRRRRWHRRSGRLVAPAGLASAGSAIWMTLSYSIPHPAGPALWTMRMGLGIAMCAGLIVAFVAIRRGDVSTHRAWMMRAYAIGLGAGTQVLTFLPWTIAVGRPPGEAMHAVLMGAGWAINLVVAEIAIRRGRRTAGRAARAGALLS
ncbi:DUF2306 domain-containing protein [Agromyces intestinalis]|uniref:DUF2306 domain-containing protein n=1 Tax=Agromyces intestinalis TaxID=2592652 RepID=A0A5C1YCR8_9MICO|nr:DUF2306 domain-containing protein [Agromyces intestinalis]QEO13796.1 DUF2306 domain-containing protein [Agromyces intestinalis]